METRSGRLVEMKHLGEGEAASQGSEALFVRFLSWRKLPDSCSLRRTLARFAFAGLLLV